MLNCSRGRPFQNIRDLVAGVERDLLAERHVGRVGIESRSEEK